MPPLKLYQGEAAMSFPVITHPVPQTLPGPPGQQIQALCPRTLEAQHFSKGFCEKRKKLMREKILDRSKKAFFFFLLIPVEGSRERVILAVSLRDVRAESSGYVKAERG